MNMSGEEQDINVLPFRGKACWQTNHSLGVHSLGVEEYLKATVIALTTIAVILLNVLMIIVLHDKNYSRYLRDLPKILMTSLSVTDLAVGTFVTPVSLLSLLYQCWPWSQTVCAIEALLISALFHQSTLSLLCIAIDRYICIVHPLRYHSLMTKKVCYAMVSFSWIISFSVYAILIYPHSEYRYDSFGIMSCEPYYKKKQIIIAATALFYIPPAVGLVFCYVTILRVANKQIKAVKGSPTNVYITNQGYDKIRKFHIREKKKTYRTLVTLGSISAGFLIAVTPWTLTELISSVWEVDVSANIQFMATWVAISNSFWNPVLYGLLNKSFRNVAIDLMSGLFCNNCFIRFVANALAKTRHDFNQTHSRPTVALDVMEP